MSYGQLQFTVTPANVTVENGRDITLPCMATGAPTILYVWRNSSVELGVGSANSTQRIYFITENNGSIVFSEVTTDDEDHYVCIALDANNVTNLIRSEPAYLTGKKILVHTKACCEV